MDQLLAEILEHRLEDNGGKLLEENDVVLQGWPGIEAKYRNGRGETVWTRIYLRDRRSYSVAATTKSESFPAETKGVFDSVRFTGNAGVLKRFGPVFTPYSFPDTEVTVSLPGAPEIRDRREDSDEGLEQMAEGVFGNRRYALAYRAATGESIDEVPEFVEKAPESGERPKGKELARSTYDAGGRTFTSVEFASGDGKTYGRTDAVKIGDRVYFFVATVPSGMKKSAEVAAFFASFRVPND